jgi:kumamolisin
MKLSARIVVLVTSLLVASAVLAQQGSTGGGAEPQVSPPTPQTENVYVPQSSKQQLAGFAHTTYVLRSPDGGKPAGQLRPTPEAAAALAGPDATTEIAETPDSMGCLYVQSPVVPGCVPQYSGGPSAASYGAIALVDAFDNPDAATDLATFDSEWGLAAPPSFTKIYANGNGDCTTPPPDAGWAGEESLDIEWAHVFAPKAAIILVEACSSSWTDLLYAEQVAFSYIATNFKTTGGQVSNSWQGGEFSGQIADDPLFADWDYTGGQGWLPHILAFASSGDGGNEGSTAGYPSANPWLISAGGTSVLRNAANDHFSSESCWSGSGGGISTYETYVTSFTGGNVGPWADFQYPIYGGTFGPAQRHTPDLSFNADPASGVWVFSQYGFGGWIPVGGTSVASPSLASIINRAGNRLGSVFLTPITGGSDWFSTWENNLLYSQLATAKAYSANFYDVKTGSNGTSAVASYDLCTGVGTPRGLLGK